MHSTNPLIMQLGGYSKATKASAGLTNNLYYQVFGDNF